MYVAREKMDCLKRIREISGLTGKDISNLLGVSTGLVYRFENKHSNPRGMASQKLAMMYVFLAFACGKENDLWRELTADGRINTTTLSSVD